MELSNRAKRAISLIELLVSLSMTAVLMLMLFGIVSKKTRDGIAHFDGVFYCWKDWDGNLYQQTSKESIQSVSACKIKIPKDAKNIQVFVIGGGAGGYKFDKSSIANIFNNNNYEKTENEQLDCLKSYESLDNDKKCLNSSASDVFTRLHTANHDYNVITECSEQNSPGGCNADVQITPKALSSIKGSVSTTSPFTNSFIDDLVDKGYCYIPLYYNGNKGFVKSTPDMVNSGLCYYMGSSSKGKCYGANKNKNNSYLSANGDSSICYQDGILISTNAEFTTDSSVTESDTLNKITYESVKSALSLGSFKESLPGDMKRGYAEAGKEYTISADKIGEGGVAGASGKATQFGNLKASGGGYKSAVNIDIALPAASIGSIKAAKEAKNFTICAQSGLNCNGIINEQMVELAANSKIKINDNAVIAPATYNKDKGKWQESTNPQKSSDDIIKTGFGFFGASGPAIDCNVKYYPVKNIKYNDLSLSGSSRAAKVDSCATLGHGMGGAIIIKWD